jgi:hypothetical protein
MAKVDYVYRGRLVQFRGDPIFLRLVDESVLQWAIEELTRKNGGHAPNVVKVSEAGHG